MLRSTGNGRRANGSRRERSSPSPSASASSTNDENRLTHRISGSPPARIVTDKLRSYPAAFRARGLTAMHHRAQEQTTGRKIHTSQSDEGSASNRSSSYRARHNTSSPFTPPPRTPFTTSAILSVDTSSKSFGLAHSRPGPTRPPTPDPAASVQNSAASGS